MPEPFEITRLALSPDSEIRTLLCQCPEIEPRRYRDGEYLMREGEESQELFIVLQGAYAVERPSEVPGAPATILATLESDVAHPSIVGEMAYFGTQLRSASVRSAGACFALCLHPRHIGTIIEGFPFLLKIIFRQFAHRLLESNHALKDLQARFALDPERRMASVGECLFREGEPAVQLFQLVIGEIRLEGPEEMRTVGPCDLPGGFLELAPFLRKQGYRCTATVDGAAFLMVVDASRREALVRSYPQLVLAELA